MAAAEEDRDEVIPRIGETIDGRYEVVADLAVGGMGAILSAIDKTNGERVAIKVMLGAAMEIEGAITRFEREARAAAGIVSEHVVRIFHVGELANGAPFMVMEFLDGKDLGAIITPDQPLPVAESVDYVLQACEAMAEAHKSGIVHRDLKPSNLFLANRSDGTKAIKVVDFGISKFAADSPVLGKEGVSLTATRTMMGSPLYMSPEQVRSAKNVDRRSDIWALGVILYELLSGRLPFEGDNAGAICAMIVADEPVPLRMMKEDLPAQLERIVMRCIEKEPAARYQDVAELADALRPFGSKVGKVAAAHAKQTMENASGILPTLHAAPIKLDLGERAAAAPMSKSATVAATPSARRSSSSSPPAASSAPPPAIERKPAKSGNFGRRVIALGILGLIGWAAWMFRVPLGVRVREAADGELAKMANADTADASALVSTPANDDAGLATLTSGAEISDAGDDAESTAIADASADDFDDAGEDEEEEDDDAGIAAVVMPGDASVAVMIHHPTSHPHPTKPVKKKKRKR
ncbi:MAG: serine/threonine-protein kinase [Polyangiaceae bacterium]